MTTRTALYRHYDADGQLLYVGISANPTRRIGEHDRASDWFTASVRCEIEWHPNRQEALYAERVAIAAEKPPHNTMHDIRGISKHLDQLADYAPEPIDEPTLPEWLAAKGVTGGEMAACIGISRPFLSEITHFRKSPGLRLALKIEDFTMGEVTARGLLAAYDAAQGDDQ